MEGEVECYVQPFSESMRYVPASTYDEERSEKTPQVLNVYDIVVPLSSTSGAVVSRATTTSCAVHVKGDLQTVHLQVAEQHLSALVQ